MKKVIIAVLVVISSGISIAALEKTQENQKKRDRQERPWKVEKPKTLDRAEPDKRQGDSFLLDGAREGAALERGRPSNPAAITWDIWGKK